MNTRDRTIKQSVNNPQTNALEKKDNASGLDKFYTMQSAIKKPSRETLTPNVVLQLQRTYGNAFVQRVISKVNKQSSIISTQSSQHTIQRVKIINGKDSGDHPKITAEIEGLNEAIVKIANPELISAKHIIAIMQTWAATDQFNTWEDAVAQAVKQYKTLKLEEAADKLKVQYAQTIAKGKERHALILKGFDSKPNQHNEQMYKEKGYKNDPVEAKESQETYATKVGHPDAEVKSVRDAEQGNHYLVTPIPEKELMIIGYYARWLKDGHPTASEVIYQIFKEAGGKIMQSVYQVNVASGSSEKILVHISALLMGRFEGDFRPGDDIYYALLGIENAPAMMYLIINRGQELGIKGISKITLSGASDVTYHFEKS